MIAIKKNSLRAVAIGMLSLYMYAHSAPKKVVESDSSKQDTSVVATQKTCPIMGGDIDKRIYTDYEENRVYFCCGGCEGTFLNDPEKYIKELEAKGEGIEKISLNIDTKSETKSKANN